jgi:hypothetical protein
VILAMFVIWWSVALAVWKFGHVGEKWTARLTDNSTTPDESAVGAQRAHALHQGTATVTPASGSSAYSLAPGPARLSSVRRY